MQAAPTTSAFQESHSVPHRPSESQGGSRISYYDPSADSFKTSHNQDLLRHIEIADLQLQSMFKNGTIESEWDKVMQIR